MKRSIKIFACVAMLITAALALTACGDKTAITTDKFTSTVEKHDMYYQSILDPGNDPEFVKEATAAAVPNKWQIEFYILAEDSNAKNMFDANKKDFEALKSGRHAESSVSSKNYDTYSLTSSGSYMHLCRVDNTLIYVSADEEYKDDIKTLLKELGYE